MKLEKNTVSAYGNKQYKNFFRDGLKKVLEITAL